VVIATLCEVNRKYMVKKCTLCHSENTSLYSKGEFREYYSCSNCSLVFVSEEFFLSPDLEKAKYDNHQNFTDDLVYQNYLKQIMDPVLDRIFPGACGLDFGCGPGPALSQMFESRGYEVDVYDVFYAPDQGVFQKSYDFITACEVVEHFHDPKMELDRLFGLLKSGGILAIKTQMLPLKEEFKSWYYKRDMTHVCFFSVGSFNSLAERWGADVEFVHSNVVLFTKTSG